jgi:hypothetical protein
LVVAELEGLEVDSVACGEAVGEDVVDIIDGEGETEGEEYGSKSSPELFCRTPK